MRVGEKCILERQWAKKRSKQLIRYRPVVKKEITLYHIYTFFFFVSFENVKSRNGRL